MKRLLPSLMLAAAVAVAGCKPKPPKPTQTNNTGTDISQPQPQPYQPTNTNSNPEPEPQPAPQPTPEVAPEHHTTHTGSSTGHKHHEKYVVKKGDTMSKIAKAHHVSLKRLEAANPKVDPNKIRAGETIIIP